MDENLEFIWCLAFSDRHFHECHFTCTVVRFDRMQFETCTSKESCIEPSKRILVRAQCHHVDRFSLALCPAVVQPFYFHPSAEQELQPLSECCVRTLRPCISAASLLCTSELDGTQRRSASSLQPLHVFHLDRGGRILATDALETGRPP